MIEVQDQFTSSCDGNDLLALCFARLDSHEGNVPSISGFVVSHKHLH